MSERWNRSYCSLVFRELIQSKAVDEVFCCFYLYTQDKNYWTIQVISDSCAATGGVGT